MRLKLRINKKIQLRKFMEESQIAKERLKLRDNNKKLRNKEMGKGEQRLNSCAEYNNRGLRGKSKNTKSHQVLELLIKYG